MVTASAAQAQLIYSAPFETPAFANGNLVGQDGWVSTDSPATPGLAMVQNAFFQSGARATRIDAAIGFASHWWWKPLNFPVIVGSAPIVQISFDMYLDATTQPLSSAWGVDVYDTSVPVARRVSAIIVNDADQVLVWDGFSFFSTGVSVTRNAWHSFRIDLNYAAPREANLFVDGQIVAQEVALEPGITMTLADVDLYHVDGNGADKGFYDNLYVVALSDTDGDGFPNVDDACPATGIGEPVDGMGCSLVDTDGDGVLNDLDLCPATLACATVNGQGCPSDSDGDTLFNGCDNCPNIANTNQDDFDRDGIGDLCDFCINRAAGDANGDGDVDGLDIPRFIGTIFGTSVNPDDDCACDLNHDLANDGFDIPLFVNILLGP